MDDETELLASLTQELRRGTLILSVLSQLSEPRYGYALVQRLQERGVTIDPGTLYPLLRRSKECFAANGIPRRLNPGNITGAPA